MIKKQNDGDGQDKKDVVVKKEQKNPSLFTKEPNSKEEISGIETKTQNDSNFIQHDIKKILPDSITDQPQKTPQTTGGNAGNNNLNGKSQDIIGNVLPDIKEDDKKIVQNMDFLAEDKTEEEVQWNLGTKDMEEELEEYIENMNKRKSRRKLRIRSGSQTKADDVVEQQEDKIVDEMRENLMKRTTEGFNKKNLRGGDLMNKLSVGNAYISGNNNQGQRGGFNQNERDRPRDDGDWNSANNKRGGDGRPDGGFENKPGPGDSSKDSNPKGNVDDHRDHFMGDRGQKNSLFSGNNANRMNDDVRGGNPDNLRGKDMGMSGGGRNDSLFDRGDKQERKPQNNWNQGNSYSNNINPPQQWSNGPSSNNNQHRGDSHQDFPEIKDQNERGPRNPPDATSMGSGHRSEGRNQN